MKQAFYAKVVAFMEALHGKKTREIFDEVGNIQSSGANFKGNRKQKPGPI
jgi:hypothetical protein